MADFKVFGDAVRARFKEMSEEPLFTVVREKEDVWEHYLASFPAGSNPIFRKRTEHDCSCCRHFMRDVGHVVAIQNGALVSVWDLNGLPEPYQTVADAMAKYIKALPIGDVFLVKEARLGVERNFDSSSETMLTWHHFSCDVPAKHRHNDIAARQGELRTTFQVLWRGVNELDPAALSTVKDLIREKAIYRGDEFKNAVEGFAKLQDLIMSAAPEKRQYLAWQAIGHPHARFRNTVIGTLVEDLSTGGALDEAVRVYEKKVAPENYKRPTALITKSMVEDAMKTIHGLGLEPALERRHARLSDVSVNSVLFVDGSVQGKMKGGVEGLLMDAVKPKEFDPKKAEEITIDAFVKTVLPKTQSLQLYLDNGLLNNFVSMTAPVAEDVEPMFKWGNNFGWSYDGNVTDSIKEKVKKAGGRVEGVELRCSLAWRNFDDLDLHCKVGSNHWYYGNKGQHLDVDMNAGGGRSREPVENMRWVKLNDGIYEFSVNQFAKRESTNVGFEIELEFAGGLMHFKYEKAVTGTIKVANVHVSKGKVVKVDPGSAVKGGSISQDKWGLKTLDLIKVNNVVLSPNHWDGATGNKHWFFILDGARNPEPCRGIYNEFLKPELEKHRKVFEVLGDKTKCPVVAEQMSGVGFSSTRGDRVTVVAVGPNLQKSYTIVF